MTKSSLLILKERKTIFEIHIRNKRRDPNNFDLAELAQKAKGFSGAEIEEAVNEALFTAYNDGREPEQNDILKAIQETWPLSKTMQESIIKLRQWAKARAKLASEANTEEIDADEKTPKLIQERHNIFA